jgi:hypothetical protein
MRPHRIGTWALSLLVAVGWLGMPGGAWGQGLSDQPSQPGDVEVVGPSPTSRTFGTATEIVHVVAAADFAAGNASDQWSIYILPNPDVGYIQRLSDDFVNWYAGLRLPAGAVVTRLEIVGCDGSSQYALRADLFRSNLPLGTGIQGLMSVSTGSTETPGCGRFSGTPSSPPLVIDNEDATYWIGVRTGASFTLSFESVRVYYQLQVSPAPAVASFGDVPPGHQFFRFIEALKASGITSGCQTSPPLYCPDQALTRGQMAVFLSTALGLHFAP